MTTLNKKKLYLLLKSIIDIEKLQSITIEYAVYELTISKKVTLEDFLKLNNDIFNIEIEEYHYNDEHFFKITYVKRKNDISITRSRIESQPSTCGILVLHNWSYSINEKIFKYVINIAKLLARESGYGAIMINHTANSLISRVIKQNRLMKKVFEIQNPRTSNIIQTFISKI